MRKYRVKERKYSDGRVTYTLQGSFFCIFYITLTRFKGLYDEVQCFSTLDEALLRLEEYKEPVVKEVETNYIYNK